MKTSIKPLLGSITLSAFVLAPPASAATIFNDTFTDGGRDNGADAQDIDWYQIANTSLSVANDPVIGGGNALIADATGNFNRFAGVFGTVTIAVGETLQLSFEMRFTQAPASGGATMRFGIFNDGGTPFIADGATGQTDDFGYGFSTNPGLASATGTTVASEAAGDSILSGPSPAGFATVAGQTSGASIDWGTTTAHSGVFSITRLSDGTLDLSASINGLAAATGNTAPLVAGNYTFNYVAFGQGGINRDYVIDNVQLTLIPEPSSALLGGLGLLSLMRRRR